MEDLRSALMEDPNEFVELDEYLESIEAPMYHDFTTLDNSKPDGPSWFCSRIGCNGEHEHVDPQELDRRFKIRVMAARTPNFKPRKASKQDDVRPTPIHARTAPAKPASAMRDRSVATKVLVFYSPKKMARKPSSQLRQKKTDCPLMKLNKEVASSVIEEELPSSDGAITSTSEGSVLSTTSDSLSTNSDSRSEVSVVHDSYQSSEVEAGVHTTELEVNKENIPSTMSLEENFERSAVVSVVHAVSQGSDIETDENATSLEENCKKPKISQKAIKEPSKIFEINHPGQGEKSRRTTKPKPFRLLTNERVVQRETNLEKKQNRDTPRETVSTLKCRDGVKSEARLAHGKTRKLGGEKLTTSSNHKCQKENLVAKLQKEAVKVASSRQPLKTPSLVAKRNSPSSSSQGNKITPANACSQGKKLEIASCLRRTEARTAQSKNVRFAGKLITTLPQSQEAECRKEKFGEQSRKDVAKVAPSRQSLKTQSKMPSRNVNSSSQHQNQVVTENETGSQGKNEQLRKVVPSRQSLKTQSKIPARIAQSSSQHRTEVATDNAPCSQGKGEQLRKEVVKMAPSRQSLKTRNEVVTANATCSLGKRLATTILKGPNLHKIHTPKDCTKKPVCWR